MPDAGHEAVTEPGNMTAAAAAADGSGTAAAGTVVVPGGTAVTVPAGIVVWQQLQPGCDQTLRSGTEQKQRPRHGAGQCPALASWPQSCLQQEHPPEQRQKFLIPPDVAVLQPWYHQSPRIELAPEPVFPAETESVSCLREPRRPAAVPAPPAYALDLFPVKSVRYGHGPVSYPADKTALMPRYQIDAGDQDVRSAARPHHHACDQKNGSKYHLTALGFSPNSVSEPFSGLRPIVIII